MIPEPGSWSKSDGWYLRCRTSGAAGRDPQAVIGVRLQTPNRWSAERHSGSVELRFLCPCEEGRGYPFAENEVGPDVLPKLTGEDLKEIGSFNRLVF
jgi:hypothetical protein